MRVQTQVVVCRSPHADIKVYKYLLKQKYALHKQIQYHYMISPRNNVNNEYYKHKQPSTAEHSASTSLTTPHTLHNTPHTSHNTPHLFTSPSHSHTPQSPTPTFSHSTFPTPHSTPPLTYHNEVCLAHSHPLQSHVGSVLCMRLHVRAYLLRPIVNFK